MLIAMESAIQPKPYQWQYADTTFKFKGADSTSDEDIIEVPGTLVQYAKSLTAMIEDFGGPTGIIPLSHITNESFQRIIHALEILVNHTSTYADLIAYFASLHQDQLLESINNINFLDIQPLLLPAAQALQQFFIQSPSDKLISELGLPEDILIILKNLALKNINTPLAICSLAAQAMPTESFSSTALTQDGTILTGGDWDNTIKLMGPQSATRLEGHTGLVNKLEFSPDGQKIASESDEDKTVRLWDTTTQQEITQFKNASNIQFSADNNYFACLENPEEGNYSYAVINSKTGQKYLLTDIEGQVNTLMPSPDGKLIALAGDKIYLWNTQTHELKTLDIEIISPIDTVAFSPDSTLLAFGGTQPEGQATKIILWNITEMALHRPLFEIETSTMPSEIIFSQDNTLVAFNDDKDVVVWDIQNVKPPIIRTSGHTEHVHAFAFTPDNKHLISTAHDNIIHIVNLSDGKEKQLAADEKDIMYDVYPIDNTTFISVTEDGSAVYMWDLVIGQSKKLLTLTDATGLNAISPDKTLIAVNSKDGKINLLNIKTGEKRIFATQSSCCLINLVFGADGKSLLTTYANGTALLWDIKTGIAHAIVGTKNKIISRAKCIGDCSLVFVQEKTKNFINLYDTKKNITTTLAHDNDINRFVFSPNGKHLISSSEDNTIIIWNVATQQAVKQLKANIDNFALSPDGNKLVISDEKHISLIDLSNNIQQIFATHPNSEESFIMNMVFNTDGTLLATRKSTEGNVKIEIWDMATHTLKHTIQLPEEGIHNYFFVPNTSVLVVVGFSGVHLWDANINEGLIQFDLHCWANAVNTSHDGSRIVISGTGENLDDPRTAIIMINQIFLKTMDILSFEQVFIIARALHAIHTGTIFDLTKSPKLLAIFNDIHPELRDILKECFKIKTD